jgi:ABC-type lipoprotein release transport system permease subunit
MVIGIAPPRFRGLVRHTSCDFWVRLDQWPETVRLRYSPSIWRLYLVARPSSLSALKGEKALLDTVFKSSLCTRSGSQSGCSGELEVRWENASRGLSKRSGPWSKYFTLISLLSALLQSAGVSALILLNIARRDAHLDRIALLYALGMGRHHLLKMLLKEVALLSAVGALLSWPLSYGVLRLFLMAIQPIMLRTGLQIEVPTMSATGLMLSSLVILGTVCMGEVITSMPLFTTVPRMNSGSTRKLFTIGNMRYGLRDIIVAVQMTTTTLVLLLSWQIISTALRLAAYPLGYNTDGLTVMSLDLQDAAVPRNDRVDIYQQLVRSLEGRTDVRSASFSSLLMLSGKDMKIPISYSESRGIETAPTSIALVSERYFDTLRIGFSHGRAFLNDDMTTNSRAAIVNLAFANSYFHSSNVVGKTFGLGGGTTSFEIVGVVNDALYVSPTEAPEPLVYLPHTRLPGIIAGLPWGMYVEVRMNGEAKLTRMEMVDYVRGLASRATISDFARQKDVVYEATAPQRILAELCLLLACSVIVVTLIGVYGLQSERVSSMGRSIAIRLAIGASRTSIIYVVLYRSLLVTLVGVALGSFCFAYIHTSPFWKVLQLGNMTASSVPVLCGTLMLILISGSIGPIRRAVTIKPASALRWE